MTNYLPTVVVCALYGLATFLLFRQLREPANAGNADGSKRTALWAATVALLLHAIITVYRTGLPDELNLPFFTAISVTGLTIVLIQLLMCLSRPADYLGLLIYPIAAAGLLASEIYADAPGKALGQHLQLHVLLSILAYSVLALGATQAVLVSVQRHYLQQHQPGGFIRALPPLTSMESLLFSLLAVGFVLLTLSLLSGFVFLEDMFAQHLVHKTVLACLAWVVFAVLLLGRWRFGWRGKRAVRWTLGGFAMLLTAYFGSKLVLELILQR